MADVIIIHQFEIFIIIVFGMHISFIILEVSKIMEVPLPRSHIGPCFKCDESFLLMSTSGSRKWRCSCARRNPFLIDGHIIQGTRYHL